MAVHGKIRKHPKIVAIFYYVGFLLLFFSLGCFSSAAFLRHKSAKWAQTTAQIQDCRLEEFGSRAQDPESKFHALRCEISYELGGRSFRDTLLTNLTRSLRERTEIDRWVVRNGSGATLTLKVNPSDPREYVVESYLPGRRGDNPGDFTNAAIIFGAASVVFLVNARALVRRGW
jgi:hypothetical protein